MGQGLLAGAQGTCVRGASVGAGAFGERGAWKDEGSPGCGAVSMPARRRGAGQSQAAAAARRLDGACLLRRMHGLLGPPLRPVWAGASAASRRRRATPCAPTTVAGTAPRCAHKARCRSHPGVAAHRHIHCCCHGARGHGSGGATTGRPRVELAEHFGGNSADMQSLAPCASHARMEGGFDLHGSCANAQFPSTPPHDLAAPMQQRPTRASRGARKVTVTDESHLSRVPRKKRGAFEQQAWTCGTHYWGAMPAE